jgi:hypothetical protein
MIFLKELIAKSGDDKEPEDIINVRFDLQSDGYHLI